MSLDLPRQNARTRRFSLGLPHSLTVSPDGTLVIFLRSESGTDPRTGLWVYDVEAATERLVVESGDLTSYDTDRDVSMVAFVREQQLHVVDLANPAVPRVLPPTHVDVPNLDPTGSRIAYGQNGALRLIELAGTTDRVLLEADGPDVAYGVSEYAATEVGRTASLWWAPAGDRLLVARVDSSPLELWHLADPTDPTQPPTPVRYPAAGTANADVTLHLVDLQGGVVDVHWDRATFEYVAAVDWSGPLPLLCVQSRDQHTAQVREIDPATGVTTLLRAETDAAWVDIVPGTPSRTSSGQLVWVTVADGSDRLLIGGRAVTPPDLQVSRVCNVDGNTVIFEAQQEPTETHLFAYCPATGVSRLSEDVGVHTGQQVGGTTVLISQTFDGPSVTVERQPLRSHVQTPVLDLRVDLIRAGERDVRTAVFWPSWHERGTRRLPVLLDPYAGPGLQVVRAARSWHYLLSQWFAEQGFVVLTTDGRGTPGRGPEFARMVHGDQLTPVLQDQVDALHATADHYGDLDLGQVAIRGWSFGGYLAAAAVLHRPETFHAAIAGAAVSDQRSYNTYWKERFLGHPTDHPEAYRHCSLLPYADRLERPLLLIQGMGDTNVWSSHMLRLSAALLDACRPHQVLPLPGQGHRPSDENVVAHLPHLELAFLRQTVGPVAA